MTEIRAIMDKKIAWETLSEEEETLLNEMRWGFGKWHKK